MLDDSATEGECSQLVPRAAQLLPVLLACVDVRRLFVVGDFVSYKSLSSCVYVWNGAAGVGVRMWTRFLRGDRLSSAVRPGEEEIQFRAAVPPNCTWETIVFQFAPNV